jgi:protein-S-isoprenylcysteine O-methyltransferase Ste14
MTVSMHHFGPLFAQNPHWRIIFWVSYSAWAVMEMLLFIRDSRAARGEKRDAGSRLVLVILIPLGIFGAFFAPYKWPGARIALPGPAVFYTAIALIWIGGLFRFWAVMTLGRFFRTSVFLQEQHKLVTSGPYRVLRHPSYTGGLLTIIGVGLAMGNWLSVAIFAGCVLLAYAWRISVEEKALAGHFGEEFAAHKQRTWALIPFIW